jgi:preprotein translocase subunit SecA
LRFESQGANRFLVIFKILLHAIFSDEVCLNAVDELQVLADLIMDVWNNTPQWSLKGWSLREAREQFGEAWRVSTDAKNKAKKIGRNEPCPCGSGKKYKKCCGK